MTQGLVGRCCCILWRCTFALNAIADLYRSWMLVLRSNDARLSVLMLVIAMLGSCSKKSLVKRV